MSPKACSASRSLDGFLQIDVICVLVFVQSLEEVSRLRHVYASLRFEHRKLLASSFTKRILRKRQDADRITNWAEQEMLRFANPNLKLIASSGNSPFVSMGKRSRTDLGSSTLHQRSLRSDIQSASGLATTPPVCRLPRPSA